MSDARNGHRHGLWQRRGLVAFLLATALATCTTDHTLIGPRPGGRAYLAIRPVLEAAASPSSFGFTIDSLRVVVIRPATDTVVDTTGFFDPNSATLRLALTVDLRAPTETFYLLLQLRAGTRVFYSGVDTTQVSAGPPDTSSSASVVLKYVGPGAGITHISIAPQDSVLTLAGTKQYRVTADSNGKPVTSFFVHWSTSDTLTAPIDTFGILHAPAVRGSVLVRATTPNNVRDSTPVTFIPVPTGVTVISGGGQTGVVATRLPFPLSVQVVASDAQGVKGIAVRFRALSGGSVRDSVVMSDAGGFAADSVTLGTVAGPQLFEASVTGLKADTIGVTAAPGAIAAARSVVTVSGATVVSGTAATLTLQAKDAFGNNLTAGGAIVAFTATGGTSTGSIGPTTDNHDGIYTTTFTGLVAGTATTIGATINGTAVSTTLPTLSVTPGAISAVTSLVSVSSGSVASGTAVTLTLLARDGAGNGLTGGGATVAFTSSGGTSSGTIGLTTDHANGTYTATFTGIVAGTATTIGATVNGNPVTTALPTVSVIAGAISATTSVITTTSGTVASGASATLTLQAKDPAGNPLTTGGATIVFTAAGGTSTGTIGSVTDHGNGTYTATFTGLLAGTATTLGATVNGTATVSTTSITVVPGNAVTAQSIITESGNTVASGGVVTLTLQARDSLGNAITSGGLTVVFTHSGGTSTGTISATTDHGNGTYTATFTAVLAGTATTIGATIGGSPVTSTLPTVTVSAGSISAATSVVTVSGGTVASGSTLTLTLQAKDAAGNVLTTGGATVVFSATGGTSTGTIGATTDHANGTYTASFTAVLAGTATTIGATINSTAVTSTLPTVTVTPGAISAATSFITVSAPAVLVGVSDTLVLRARDAAGNNLTAGGALVVFTQSGGSSVGAISTTVDLGSGTYRALFTGVTAGTPTTIGATINTVAVTSTLPTIAVTATVHSVDITADSTWTAALSPHIVNGYLRIRNGATLTIQSGAVVKFNAGSGLQVGDTALNQSGGLIMDGTQPGTAPGITLTANTGSPVPGFWKGIEVQRNLALTTWRRALIEWAGGTRTAFGALPSEACILFVNRSGAEVDLDSMRLRQCVHAGVHHFGGTSHIHRSEVDSVTGSGIHADLDATLQLDSNTVRGSGQEGLLIGSPVTHLAPSRFNRFLGNATFGIQIQAAQLPGLLKQDSIAGNATDFIAVTGGQPDPTAAAFTISAQPQRSGSNGYVVTGLLDVGRSTGQTVTLDSNLVLRFGTQSGVLIGDSAGTRSGSIASLGTNRTNAPRLTSASLSPAAGDWYGLEIGRLSANTRLSNVRIEFAGDSIGGRSKHRFGLLVRSPAAQTLAVDSVVVVQSGRTGSDTNSAGFGILGIGAGVDVRRSVAQGNAGYGFAIAGGANIKVVADTAKSNTVGFAIFTDSGGASPVGPGDSVANNVATGNTLYPLTIHAGRLPILFGNAFAGNGRDTLLLTGGGSLSHSGTLIKVPGVPWRVTHLVQVDSDAVLTIAPRDTIAFDSLAGVVVGDSAPAALRAVSTGGPVLLTAASGNTHWFGLQFQGLSQADTLMNVVIEKAGFVGGGCQIACDVQFLIVFGSVNYTSSTPLPLVLDSVTIRQAVGYAVSSTPSASGAVFIKHSQFYNNAYTTAFNTSSGLALSIDSSDIYHYRPGFGQPVIVNKAVDSVTARHNWWGDISGPGVATLSNPPPDSIGRALLDEVNFPVAYQPFAGAPYFPVSGTLAALVGTPDSVLLSLQTGQQLTDSVRVRGLDAVGRGLSGQSVTWSAGPGNGTLAPTSGTTDIGGRTGAHWSVGLLAKTDTAKATSGAGSTHLFVDMLPGPTTTVSWELLPSLTQGTLSTDSNTVTFTSTGRRGVIIAHAFDANGNATQPSSLEFEDVPTPVGPQPYGLADSSKGDTIFFHTTVTTPAAFQLHGFYTGVSGNLEDSVFINMNAQAKGLQINQDTAQLNSLCPTGPLNSACSRSFFAQLIDSAGTPLPPSGAFVIQWAKVGAGTAVTLDSVRGVMGEIAYVTARQNGNDAILAQRLQGPTLVPAADTLAITVQQVPFQILINPASTPAGLGDTVTFTAAVSDLGGNAVVPSPAIHWRADPPYTGFVTFIDTTTTNGVAKIRLDSVYQSFFQTPVDVITALAARGPGDTLVHFAQFINPIQADVLGQGSNPFAAAVNPKDGRVYVVNQFSNPGTVQVFDSTPANIATVQLTDIGPHGIAVDPVRNRIYVTNSSSETVSVIDGTTNTQVTGFIALGPNSGAVAVDTVSGLAYATGLYCVDFPANCATPFLKVIGSNGAALVDSIQLPDTGRGVAVQYNAGGERIFVSLVNDTVVVIDPVAKTIVSKIGMPSGSFLTGVAVNSITKRVYVAEYSASQIGVIDGTPGVDTLFTNTSISVNNPNFVSVNEKRNLVYSAASSNNFVLELDGATNNIRHEYVIGSFSDFPQDAAINAADQRVYVPHPSALTLLKFFTH